MACALQESKGAARERSRVSRDPPQTRSAADSIRWYSDVAPIIESRLRSANFTTCRGTSYSASSAWATTARALAGKVPGLQQAGTLAAVCAEAAWLSGDHDGVVREVRPAYDLVCRRIDPRMKGERAAWLWRVNALGAHPSDIQEPYALEISGDWKGASRAWEILGCPYEHACMLAWYGAEDEQRLALAMFEQLGATPAMVALRKQMRDRGVRGVPRGARTSTRSHPNGLTRREAEILKFLCDGLRNSAIASRLFVSTKTVDHHVSAILTKLGARTRAEAVALAHRQAGGVGALEGDGVGGAPSL